MAKPNAAILFSVLLFKGAKQKVHHMTLHPKWDPEKIVNDIAVITLEKGKGVHLNL
jgi:hypothetical protein